MIELTEEMRDILDRAAGREHSRAGAVMQTLRELLDVVERDYRVEPRPPWELPSPCGQIEMHEAHFYGEYGDERCLGVS